MPLAKPLGPIDDAARWRFVGKTMRTDSGCLVWTGNLARNGYGQFWLNSRMAAAHRVSWVMANGEQPPGMQLDHLCRNRRCVEVSHLELTTPAENSRRGAEARVRSLSTCSNGHEYATVGYYLTRAGGRVCRECKRIVARNQWAKKRGLASILGEVSDAS